ncbi:MAG: dephospho-CoA kinase [Flavobacteriales bacterium]|nr:dephospho-CoA kinase [Flavobacteriales bacterium]MBK6752148.1 dephospho-CoA kinase [Flavobacteriales bacterium]MBK7086320.1 dephospho-CoA kinase [Flavobacteriales bacterium]MBK7269052.1 dephospho-CoA kinase [Flavobacteriales bacterium]MBK7752394.1 dephospho-CoA kinase [Flavobacteriales bacterium]
MYTVGVTGGIGSGKSLVCRILSILGVPVFHADEEAKRLLVEPGAVRSQVEQAFGMDAYPHGELDRAKLAKVVFNDADARARLNAIVHPAVRERFRSWAAEQKAAYVVMEAALLVETGGAKHLDHLVVVSAPQELRVQRVMERDGVSAEQVNARISAQAPEADLLAAAGSVIVNDGSQLLLPQVLALHKRLAHAIA